MILAIDPGASGALAFFDTTAGTLEIIDMPTVEVQRSGKAKREISPALLATTIGRAQVSLSTPPITLVVLERVGAMPGQGVSSTFQFGRGVGMVEGVVSALRMPMQYVTPQRWQKDLNVRGGKDGSRQRAAELFPAYANLFALKKWDGRADAALMAYWGASR
jgi:crossover junction endodeoxyribonuclease RuvC